MAWTLLGTLAGEEGDTGPTGPSGADGATGATGSTGATGVRGSKWFAAAGTPGSANGIAATAGSIAGDFYLDTDTGQFYELTA